MYFDYLIKIGESSKANRRLVWDRLRIEVFKSNSNWFNMNRDFGVSQYRMILVIIKEI